VELAKELVVVGGEEMVKRAVALDELLRKQSPLALVRAVELAELVLDASTLGMPRTREVRGVMGRRLRRARVRFQRR
jgi:hypothetical protein